MKYLIYARVSERGSTWHLRGIENTTETQIANVTAYIQRIDHSPQIETARDEYVTGTKNVRPVFSKILKSAKDGSATWDCLAVDDIDRLTRSMDGFCEILRILEKSGKTLISVKQQMDYASPSGRMMMQVLVAAGEYFARQGAMKTKEKMTYAASLGCYLAGRAPFGYDKGEGNVLIQNPTEATAVRDIFSRYARGETITTIRRVYPMPKNTVTKMLHNPTYAGKIVYAGQVFDGKHEAIVTNELWQAVQATLPKGVDKPRPQRQHYDYLLSGLIRCTCGKAMSPATCTGKGGGKHPYYRCSDSAMCPDKQYIRADKLETATLRAVASSYRDPATVANIVDGIRRRVDQTESEFGPIIKQNRAAMREATQKRDRFIMAFADGLVTRENAPTFNSEIARLNAQLEALERNTRDLEAKTEGAKTQVFTSEQIAAAWHSLATRLETCEDRQEVKRFVRSTVTRIEKQKDGWKVLFLLPSSHQSTVSLQGSTTEPEWHPLRELELPIWLKKSTALFHRDFA